MLKSFNLIECIEDAEISDKFYNLYRVTDNTMLILDREFLDILKKSDAIWVYREYMSMDAEELAAKLDDGEIMNKWMESKDEANAPDFPMFLSEEYGASVLISNSMYKTNDDDMRVMLKCCIVDLPAMKLAESLGNKIFVPGGDAKAIVFSSKSTVSFIKRVQEDGRMKNVLVKSMSYEDLIRMIGVEF